MKNSTCNQWDGWDGWNGSDGLCQVRDGMARTGAIFSSPRRVHHHPFILLTKSECVRPSHYRGGVITIGS